MDPIGLTIGVIGLAMAYADVFKRMSAVKSYNQDYHLFTTKFETELLRLLLWGQAVGLSLMTDGTTPSQ